MSTKTLRKRIALVAVATLGAGVLSVAPASANYALGEFTIGAVSSIQNGGACKITDSNTYGLTVGTFTNGSLVTILADGVTAGDDVYISVSGPAVIDSYTLAADATGVYGSSGATVTSTTVTDTTTAVNDRLNLRLTGLGKVSVAIGVSATTAVLDVITITSVASCATTTFSAADSTYETATATDSSPNGEPESTYSYVNADIAYVSIEAKNAYAVALPAGIFAASTTTGCVVDIATSSPASTALSSTTDSVVADGTIIYVSVEQKTTGTAITCPVTVTYNGASIYSKSILFKGQLAKITVSGVDVQAIGGSTLTGIYDVIATDAAGNLLAETVAGDASRYTTIVTAVNGGTTTTTGTGALATAADATWTCASKSGKATVRLVGTNADGDYVYSNDFEALCGGAAYTYTASLDKASYVPGDIATLTVTAKDASGFAPFKGETVNSDSSAAPSIAGSQMTAVNTPAAADTFNASGVKTYTFTVGSTAGKYNMAVNLGYTGNAAVAVAYSVASDGSTSNADVLKAIVSLIASINKQIAALQKALLRR
jgi:trimeric autotransporter adhesin